MTRRPTLYWIQRASAYGYYDVSETVEILSTAKAMLARYIEDDPSRHYRIAQYEPDGPED